MIRRDLKKTTRLTITLIVFLFSIFCFSVLNDSQVIADPSIQKDILSPDNSHPLVVYYSRSGKTRIAASELTDNLSCETAEIKSIEDRSGFFGVLTCVLDQLFERDAQIEPFEKDVKGYNPIIIATPIWIGKLSSPARTFIKQSDLQGKEIYILLTYNGSLTEEKENALKEGIISQDINLKELYKVITKEKTNNEIKKDISTQLEKRPIVEQKVISSTVITNQ